MSEEVLVKMEGIWKRFDGVIALQDVDVSLTHSEILGLIGDNGAGKSTLIKILAGVYQADSGKILFEGKEVRIKNPKDAKKLGIETVYQELALVDNIDAAGNIFLGREPARTSFHNWLDLLNKSKMRTEAKHILESLEIEIGSMEENVGNLSGGQRQAVAVARALYTKPQVVIMDEPTAALAVQEAQKVLNLIKQLKERGISVILISHTLQDVFSTADRIAILRNGRKVEDEKTENISMDEAVKLIVGRKRVQASASNGRG